MSDRPASVEVNISNLSTPPHIALAGTPGQVEAYLGSIAPSADERPRIEFTTVKSVLGHRLLQRAHRAVAKGAEGTGGQQSSPEDELLTAMIGPLHASFRDEMPTGSQLEHLFPHTDTSLQQMALIQGLIGPRRAILYPRQHHVVAANYSRLAGVFLARPFHQQPRDPALWGLTPDASADEVEGRMTEHGFDDGTPDTAHSILLAGVVDQLGAAGLLGELHVSLGRTDLPPDQAAQSAKAMKAFVDSPNAALDTPEGKMVFNVFQHWSQRGGDYFVALETATPRPWETRQARYRQQAALATIHGLRAMAGLSLSVHP